MRGKTTIFLLFLFLSVLSKAESLDSILIRMELDTAKYYITLDIERSKALFNNLYEKVRSSDLYAIKQETLKGIGVIYHIEGNYERAMDYYLRSLIYAQKINALRPIATLYYNIALIYGSQNDWEQSRMNYEKCSKYALQAKDTINMIRSAHGVAYVNMNLSQLEYAYEGFEECYELSKKYNRPEMYLNCWAGMVEIAYNMKQFERSPVKDSIYENLILEGNPGEVSRRWFEYYSSFGYYNIELSPDEAISYLKKGLDKSLETSYNAYPIYCANLITEKLLEYNRLAEVPYYLTMCEELLANFSAKDLEKEFWLNKTNYYTKTHQYKKSFEASLKYAALNNEAIQNKSGNVVQHIRNNKDAAEKDKEILSDKLKILDHESEILKKNLNYSTNLVSLILFGVFVICFFIWRDSRQKRKFRGILAAKNKKLQESDRAKTKFIDSITHELRTPLQTISGLVGLIKNTEDEDEVREHLSTLEFSKTYLSSFVDNMVSINANSNQNFELLRQEPINIREMIKSLTNSIRVIGTENDLFTQIDKEIPEQFMGDSLKMSQILYNLINNANKFTHGGEIHIRLYMKKVDNETFEIDFQIEDTGIGIEKNKQQQVFETFYRGETGDKLYEGHGIGLSVVKRMIELQGRSIELKSERGKGTTFYFTLGFRYLPQKQIMKLAITNRDKPVMGAIANEKIHILLVEDNRINQLIVKKIINKKGWACTIASNGLEAIEKAKMHSFNLILMDIMMPEMNGYEATREIRKFNKDVPILALTAVSRYENEKYFKEVGIETIIGKPVDPNSFYETIAENIDFKMPA